MCDGRPFASPPSRRLAGRGAIFRGVPFRWVLHFVLSLTRCLTIHDVTSCTRRILYMNVGANIITCRASSFLPNGVSGARKSAREGYRPDLLQDVPDQGQHMLTSGAHVPGLASGSNRKIRSIQTFFLTTNNNEALFQLPHAPVGGRMLSNHHKFYRVLQVGIHVAISLTEVCDVFLGTLGVSLDRSFSSQKNRELKLKYFRKLLDNNNILSPGGAWKG